VPALTQACSRRPELLTGEVRSAPTPAPADRISAAHMSARPPGSRTRPACNSRESIGPQRPRIETSVAQACHKRACMLAAPHLGRAPGAKRRASPCACLQRSLHSSDRPAATRLASNTLCASVSRLAGAARGLPRQPTGDVSRSSMEAQAPPHCSQCFSCACLVLSDARSPCLQAGTRALQG